MTSTLVAYPLDVLRLRLAVEPGSKTMSQVTLSMLREEEVTSIKVSKEAGDIPRNCSDLSDTRDAYVLPSGHCEKTNERLTLQYYTRCFPRGIVERDGVVGLYRGFVPNALKSLPNSSIKLTAFDTVKSLIASGRKELEKIVDGNKENLAN